MKICQNTAELTKLPEDVLARAYKAQDTRPIAIDDGVVKEFQEASDRATRYGILSKQVDVSKAVDRSFTQAAPAIELAGGCAARMRIVAIAAISDNTVATLNSVP